MADDYDVIIIGSGAGGGTLAWKLAPTGLRILLLERGDYLPRERDNWDTDAVFLRGKYLTPERWVDDALFRPESAQRWRSLINLGLTDALRAVTDEPRYTFWDFKTYGWDRDDGIRIDHLLLSPQAADRLEDVVVHREVRGREKPSDHVPVEGIFAF